MTPPVTPGAPTASSATATHDASERRVAARALLVTPILTAHHDAELMSLIRRHSAALKSAFATTLGYPLVIEASFARLVKAPLTSDTPTRAARRANNDRTEFTPRTYAYLALVCAGLLSPDTGEQVLLSHLVDQLRSDAVNAGITVDETISERRNLVAAIDLLVSWGVLVETEGTAAAWGERQDEALLTINRGLLPHLLAHPLHTLTSPEQIWAEDPSMPEQPRRGLRRKVLENPLVRREDLTESERDVLSRERTELSRVLEETFGLTLEVRAEGALAYDADEEVTDVAFPGGGTARQAALLLLDALIDTLKPTAATTVVIAGSPVPGVLAPWDMVEDELATLAERNAKFWRADYAQDPARLRADAVSVLVDVSLATVTDDGLAIHPAAARYRPDPQRAPAKTRALQRLEDTSDAGPALFEDADPTPETR